MTSTVAPDLDPIQLEVQWDRLSAATDEAASAMLRSAFSTIIRESNDYTVVIMDRSGRTMTETRAGIPAFAGLVGTLTEMLLERMPAHTWRDGDCVVTNDPWIATGHLPDLAMIAPLFHDGALVGFTGTAAHLPDIGGSGGLATDLMGEGILIPPLHLYRAGELNEAVRDLILANVRVPDQVWGDVQAQATAHAVCRRRAQEFLEEFDEPGFERFATAVHALTDRAMRTAVGALPDGIYTASVDADGLPGRPTHIACAVTIAGESVTIDYTGSSDQVDFPTNCTLNYTRAYSMYPLKLVLDPSTRTNHGSYRAMQLVAPEGTIVNPRFPVPVVARHLTGHLLSCAIYRALAPILPDRIIADSGGAPALRVRFTGHDEDGTPWALMLFANAGMGASSHQDGLATTAFPTNSGTGSIEAMEASAPLRFLRKELRADSGGPGTYRGGMGQVIEVQNPPGRPVQVGLLGDRQTRPARGVLGGGDGAVATAFLGSGDPVPLKTVTVLPPGESITICFPGGGGYGDPAGRDPDRHTHDLAMGYVTEGEHR